MSSSDNASQSTPAVAPRRVRVLRLNAILALPILIVPALLAYYLMIDGVVRDQVLAQSAELAGYKGQAEVDHVSFSIFGPKLVVRELRAWQGLEGKPHEVLYVGEAVFDVEFWPLLERRLVVNEVTASRIRYQSPLPEPAPTGGAGGSGGTGGTQGEPVPDTPNDYVNDYLKKVDEFLKSDEYRQGREWLEKLRKYMDEREDKQAKEAERKLKDLTGRADRATYVVRALREQGEPPALIVKKAGVSELEFVLGEAGNKQLGSKLSNVELTAQSVSSDPVSYKLPMEFKAGGNLDGDAARRVELGLVLRFDPAELVKLEQVKGGFTLAKLPLEGLVDTSEFGDALTGAELSLVHYAPEFPGIGGRTRLSLAGGINPPGFSLPGKPSRLRLNLWFGGFSKDTKMGAFLPSGIGISVENVALDGLLAKSGGFGLPLVKGSSFSFGTCDENGRFDTERAAISWHDGIDLRLRLSVNNLRFDEVGAKGRQSLGLPADLLAKGLNRVLEGLSADGRQLELVVGFSGKASQFKFGIMRPGLRTFVDACINALYLSGDEIKSLVDLPFAITKDGRIGLTSVDKVGVKRAPVFEVEKASDEGLSDLRVALSLSGLMIAPKPGQKSIAGLPADDFCAAFNTFVQNQGEAGLNFRCRLFNEVGSFSPALESPGLRGLVDALVGVFSYDGRQLNTKFNLPFVLPDNLKAGLLSVDADGSVRNLNSLGADSDDLSNLRVVLSVANATIGPKPGESKILGLPAGDFCDAFNRFSASQPGGKLDLRLRVFGEGAAFSPALESPGTRGLVDAVIGAFAYSGKQLNEKYQLPFVLADGAQASLSSVDAQGNLRTFKSPGADGSSLADLRVALTVSDARISPRPGQDRILGLPAREFCTGFNQYVESLKGKPMSFRLRAFDDAGTFSPALESPGSRGIVDSVINTVTFSGKQLNESFDLPFTVHDLASVRSVSVTQDGKPRDLSSAGADSGEMSNLRLVVYVANAYAVKKPGQEKILGIPADYFIFAWNSLVSSFPQGGMPLTFALFDGTGKFAPSLAGPPPQTLLTMMGNAIGIAAFEKNFGQIDAKYKNAFESFKKGDLSKAGDLAKAIQGGKDITPGELPKELPKEIPKTPPKIPKTPWG